MGPRLRAALGIATLVLVSLGVCLALLEAGLRLFWDGYYVKFRRDLPDGGIQFHPERGWALVPGVQTRKGDAEFTVTQTHNAMGLRGPEIAPEKLPGRVRVLVLGDSMTYGHGVEDDETYSAVLQRLAPSLEVINAGVGNYSGVQQLLLLQDEGVALRPDVVLVGFFWNDVYDAYHSQYGHFALEEGRLRYRAPDPVSPDHPAFGNRSRRSRERAERYDTPLTRSYSYRFLSDRLKLLQLILKERFEDDTDPGHAPADDERERAWALSFALLSEMRRVSLSLGAHFAITAIPDQAEIEPGIRLVGATPVLFETRERLRAFAEQQGIPFIDLHSGVKRARAESREPFFFRFDRHWNARGHAAAAAALHAGLERLGWIHAADALRKRAARSDRGGSPPDRAPAPRSGG